MARYRIHVVQSHYRFVMLTWKTIDPLKIYTNDTAAHCKYRLLISVNQFQKRHKRINRHSMKTQNWSVTGEKSDGRGKERESSQERWRWQYLQNWIN